MGVFVPPDCYVVLSKMLFLIPYRGCLTVMGILSLENLPLVLFDNEELRHG